MKLFLASSLNQTLPLLKSLWPQEKSQHPEVAFIANAADPYEEKWWIDSDRNKLRELGYNVTDVDLRTITSEAFSKILDKSDMLCVGGGSVYYLMGLIKKRNFDAVLIEAITTKNIIYAGSSAGSIIVSDSIKAFSYDEEEIPHLQEVPDHKGLGLINFDVVPHCNNVQFHEGHKKMLDHMAEDPTPLIFIEDHQAVVVEDGKCEIIAI